MRVDGGRTFIENNWLKVDISSLDEEQVSKLQSYLAGKKTASTVYVDDFRHITADQNKKIHAMIGDMARYTGYTPKEMEEMLKYFYVEKTGKEMPDFADCSVETASRFIEMELDIAFNQDIPFKTKTWDSLASNFYAQAQAVIHRRCIICGKPHSDIDHIDTVGMGNNRNHIDHRKHYITCLCRTHHEQRHAMDTTTGSPLVFFEAHHIKPIKPNDWLVKKLNLMTQAQIDAYNEKYERERLYKKAIREIR